MIVVVVLRDFTFSLQLFLSMHYIHPEAPVQEAAVAQPVEQISSTWNQTYQGYTYVPTPKVTPQNTVYVNNINEKVKIPGDKNILHS